VTATEATIGLCSLCRHARVQRNAEGNQFWRCGRADSDDRYLRYPPLPVSACHGHERGEPRESRAAGPK